MTQRMVPFGRLEAGTLHLAKYLIRIAVYILFAKVDVFNETARVERNNLILKRERMYEVYSPSFRHRYHVSLETLKRRQISRTVWPAASMRRISGSLS